MNAPSDSCIYDEVTVIGRVVTATAEPVPPMSSEPDTEVPTPLKKPTLMIITCLVMTCNLIQVLRPRFRSIQTVLITRPSSSPCSQP